MIELSRIRSALLEKGVDAHIEVRAVTGSTNDDAKEAQARGVSVPAIFVAEEQTHGRGRGGSAWLSRPGEGVLLSVLLRPELAAASSAPLTLAVGVAIAELLEKRSSRQVLIKWPNDLWLDEKKIAGILVEGQIRADKLVSVIVGVGINVHARDLPPEIAEIATSLAMAGIESRDRSDLIAELSLAIIQSVERFSLEGLRPFIGGARSRDALLGHPIEVGAARGIADGIDDLGRIIILRTNGERDHAASGHVVRLPIT